MVNKEVVKILLFKVGQLCPIEVQEGNTVLLENGTFTLFVKMEFLEEQDIESFKSGDTQIALSRYSNKTLFFIYRIEGFSYYVEAPFTICSTEGRLNNIRNNFSVELGYEFNIVLIEEETNVVKAIRHFRLPIDSSNKINELLSEQFAAGCGGFEQEVSEAYKKYSGEQLFKELSVVTITFRN